jgi:hypothetical protein
MFFNMQRPSGGAETGAAELGGQRRELPVILRLLVPGLLLALGLFFLFHPMLRGGLGEIPGDLGDARLVNYLLEHSFLWATGRSDHAELWNLPMFYPRQNIFAYSETLLGAAPFYWFWRTLSIAPETSFQLWMLTMAALDFLAAFLLLRRGLRLGTLAAGAGAFLFAFGGARAIHLQHAQLLPHFFTLLAVYALLAVARSPGGAPSPGGVLAAALAIVAQLYASFYLGWFLLLGLALLALVALARRPTREDLFRLARLNGRGLLVAGVVSLLALSPLLVHYSRAAAELPGRHPWDPTFHMVPNLASWVTLGPRSWLYGWMEDPRLWALLRRAGPPEVSIGMGLLTSLCAALGLWQAARTRPWMAAVLGATVLLLLLTLRLPRGVTAWRLLWLYLPSATAMRAVFRIGVFALLPAALGLAWFLETRRHGWVAVLLAGLCIAEQGTTMVTYSKRAAQQRADWIAERVGPGCRAFFFIADRQGDAAQPSLFYHVDAMAAQARRGVPTINGYSSQIPPGYDLYEIVAHLPVDHRAVHDRLNGWIARERLDPAGVCVVEQPYPFF